MSSNVRQECFESIVIVIIHKLIYLDENVLRPFFELFQNYDLTVEQSKPLCPSHQQKNVLRTQISIPPNSYTLTSKKSRRKLDVQAPSVFRGPYSINGPFSRLAQSGDIEGHRPQS